MDPDDGNARQGPRDEKCEFSIVNHKEAQNSQGGRGHTLTMNVTCPAPTLTPSPAEIIQPHSQAVPCASAPFPSTELREDGPCFSKPKSKDAGDLVLRKEFPAGPPHSNALALALIINIYHYDSSCFLDKKEHDRHGSNEDVKRLAEMFNKYKVGVYYTATHAAETDTPIYVEAPKIRQWIKDFKKLVENEKEKSGQDKIACFVCIMGHGSNNGFLLDSKCGGIHMETEIFHQFNNENFPAMQNSPKIFFMNCCRGNEPSRRVSLVTDGPSQSRERTLVNIADMLIFWSTTPEHVSARDESTGSVFIQKLCAFLQKQYHHLTIEENKRLQPAHSTHIDTILKGVARRMREVTYTDKDGIKHSQTPNIDNRSFGWFWWLIGDFDYSLNDGLPTYLKDFNP